MFRHPAELTRGQLVDLVGQLQRQLYLDRKGHWDPDQDWSADTLADIAALMHRFGLVPVANHDPFQVS